MTKGKPRILIICTGNSCRSQMAEGYLKSFGTDIEVYSAGSRPEKTVAPRAVKVMKEDGVDISSHYPKNVNEFINQSFDFLVTVCDSAKESCPIFTGEVKNRIHHSFEDPWGATGTEEEQIEKYREVRDKIKSWFREFYDEKIIQ